MYNKLFTKILDSSIWLEPTPTRIVWLTLIAVMDEHGFAQFAAVRNVAHRARVTTEEAQQAINTLENPDPESSDQDNEGRRIQRVPGGWMILNSEKHRKMVNRAVIQEQTRERVRRFRDRLNADVTPGNASVTVGNESNKSVTPSEAEAETEARSKSETKKEQEKNPPTARSKRPIFTGQKLTIFEWMLDDCMKTLGQFTDQFDLHEWFFSLDRLAFESNLVIPKRDGGAWLQAQLLAEAERRGLPLVVDVPKNKQITAIRQMGREFLK